MEKFKINLKYYDFMEENEITLCFKKQILVMPDILNTNDSN